MKRMTQDIGKRIKTPKKGIVEPNIKQENNKIEAKVDKRVNNGKPKMIQEKDIKYSLSKYLPKIYQFYWEILRSKKGQYTDYKFKISQEVLNKLASDMKSQEEKPSIGNVNFIIGYDTKQIESMADKAIEGEVTP